MNFFGIATGTDTYALSVSERSELRPGDIVTVVFLHDNTGASTLNVNGFGPVPLLRNASAMSAGDLVASTTYQFCYTGASFVQDVQASAGATTDASLLTSGTLAAARLPSNINAANLADGSVSNTELQYINSVTSNVQSQLDNKAALSHSHAASDIPARRTLIATLASQTLAGGYNRLAFASATRNDGLFTVSSDVFTAVANCVVQVSWALYSAGSAQVHPVVRKNASNYLQASPSQISTGCYASIPVELSTGDTLEVYAYSYTGSIDLDISIAALNKLIIVEA
jgi:hypothetical protein